MDRTLFARGMPWIVSFADGVTRSEGCQVCGRGERYGALGNVRALLDPRRGTQWPDLIGCGARVGLFVASARFVGSLRSRSVRVELGGRVEFAEPTPDRLSLEEAPDYYWVDGARHRAARMDFEASGYVGVERCSVCGRWWEDINASRPCEHPIVFEFDASSGLDLFTTDMGPQVFYCTDRVLECAKNHRLTNVALRPVEDGPLAQPVTYWR